MIKEAKKHLKILAEHHMMLMTYLTCSLGVAVGEAKGTIVLKT